MRARAAQHSRRVSDQPHPSQRGGATLFARRANNGGGGVNYEKLFGNPLGSRTIAPPLRGIARLVTAYTGRNFTLRVKLLFPDRYAVWGGDGEKKEKS